MTPPEFSVLLLAWNDADPSVAVLGGAALPPTLPLVYQLAVQQPVVAVYPHLPAPEESASPEIEPETAPSTPEAGSTPDALTAETPTAGILLLDAPTSAPAALPTTPPAAPWHLISSRIIGVEDLTPASLPPLAEALVPEVATAAERPALRTRSQWPTGAHAPQPRPWLAPAAPYVGASVPAPLSPALLVPNPTARTTRSVREAADLLLGTAFLAPAAAAAGTLRPPAHPQAGDLSFDPDPELPPGPFSEVVEEPGAFEASALSAPEDDVTLEPAETSTALTEPASPAGPEPLAAPEPTPLIPALDGLNFRIIQYARRAAQLVREHPSFGVIYAPNWPAWLAALEIRNSTGQPLVLYAASLAADFGSVGDRGWLVEVERMTLRRARVILVPSEGIGHRLREQYGATIGEVRVVAAADETAVQRVLAEVATA